MSRFTLPGLRTPLPRYLPAVVLVLAASVCSPLSAQTPTVPQIPAFLPRVDQGAATQPMPLDGTWLISTIGKKIRIEAGRAYAYDGWLHLFVLKVEPGMVVIRNITPTGPGQYSGEDLPLMGQWSAKVQADRSLSVSVAGALGPVSYKLMPVQLDNPQWYAQEMQAAGLSPQYGVQTGGYQFTQPAGGAPQQGYQPAPGYTPQQPPSMPGTAPQPPAPATAACEVMQFDPRTGNTVCMD